LGPYLAEELVLPLVLAGGESLTTVKPSQHAITASDIAKRFTGRRIELILQSDREQLLTVG
jgi:RNA 3'-terminal phosphate cyclase (ATP)